MASELNGVAVACTLAGGVFAYAAIKGKSVSQTVRALMAGQNPVVVPGPSGISAVTAQVNSGVAAKGGTVSTNKAIAKVLAAGYGWDSGPQWDALDQLWQRESSWSNTAENPSGAYGIPQALPPTKLPAGGQKPTSNASVQISWGLAYIHDTYGDPINAWAHETSAGWY